MRTDAAAGFVAAGFVAAVAVVAAGAGRDLR